MIQVTVKVVFLNQCLIIKVVISVPDIKTVYFVKRFLPILFHHFPVPKSDKYTQEEKWSANFNT